jgi:hypothetical protein
VQYRGVVAVMVVVPILLAQEQTPAEFVKVPAGTHIQLELISQLNSRSSRAGDRVRAQTVFPVSIGRKVVIPPGTFVEGVLERVNRSGHPKFHMRFQRVTFTNGYSVTGGDGKASARLAMPPPTRIPAGGFGFQFPPLTPPTLQPPPRPGPSPALVGGAIAGSIALAVIVGLASGRGRSAFVVNAGERFEMVLAADLLLDPKELAAVQ